ncbi:hypothetical protein OXPF_29730 [Oxobacter pfennigii]|uniref:Alkaline phosphatase n=2 Tax=Oxobacter pfennigii TaxID=36849 RepID=A0A0P8W6B0_9CLOT|nr:hypothetical protein OXPF_29730 [Oxobacter pfennigii]
MDIAASVESKVNGFKYGDLTSVAVSTDNSKLAVAIQAENYNEKGVVAIYAIDNSQDTLGEPEYVKVGIQPDMVVFADNNTVLTADEGEPLSNGSYAYVALQESNALAVLDIKTSTFTNICRTNT